MTVENISNKAQVQGDNSTVAFDFTAKIFKSSDLSVYKTTRSTGALNTVLVLNTDYTVTFVSGTAGGTVTYTVAPTTLQDSLISREVDLDQSTSYPVESNLPEKTFENSLDKLTMITQQLNEKASRSLTFLESSSLSDVTLPEPEAGKTLVGNTAGTGYENSTDDFDDIVTDAEAAQTGAETAETNAEASETAAGLSEIAAALSALEAAASAGTVNLPNISGSTAGQGLAVNAGKTGYEFTDLVTGVAGLDDVTITSLADNEILQYDSAADKWKNEALAAGSNEKIKVSATDTTAGYLETKLLSGTGISLTKGSGGGNETLTVASTVSGLVDSGCSVYANADITGITGSEQAVILNTELFDKNTEFATGVFTAKQAGRYLITLQFAATITDGSASSFPILKAGGVAIWTGEGFTTGTKYWTVAIVTDSLSIADTINLQITVGAGTTLIVEGGSSGVMGTAQMQISYMGT